MRLCCPFQLGADRRRHNQFVHGVTSQTLPSPESIKVLLEVIRRHGAEKSIKVKRLHRHFTLEHKHVLQRFTITDRPGWYRTQSVQVDSIDRQPLYPLAFTVASGRVVPYEFGSHPPFSAAIDLKLLDELADTIEQRGLQHILGFEAIQGEGEMIEFLLNDGCIIVPVGAVGEAFKNEASLQATDWSWALGKDGLVDCKGEVHCVVNEDGDHPKWTNGKAGWKSMIQAMVRDGILK